MINKIFKGLLKGCLILTSILVIGLYFETEIYNQTVSVWIQWASVLALLYFAVVLELTKEGM